MDEISLSVPEPLLESLPADDGAAAPDMERAVEGWESRINRALETEDDPAGYLADVVEHFLDRADRFDAFVPELRAWGQSPIYAIAWRNLYADLVGQLYDHPAVADSVDRERNARIVRDGIRFGDG